MESSGNLPTIDPDHEQDELDSSDERPALRAKALAALRRARMKVNGNVKKTRLTVAAVDDECSRNPDDSRITRTLRLEPKKVLEGLGPDGSGEEQPGGG